MKSSLDSPTLPPAGTPDQLTSESVRLRVEGEVATLTLGHEDEPVVALTLRRMESLDSALDQLERAAKCGEIRGLVIRGANQRMFCAGADLKLLHLVQGGNIPLIQEALSAGKALLAEERQKLAELTRENLHELASYLSQEGMRV